MSQKSSAPAASAEGAARKPSPSDGTLGNWHMSLPDFLVERGWTFGGTFHAPSQPEESARSANCKTYPLGF